MKNRTLLIGKIFGLITILFCVSPYQVIFFSLSYFLCLIFIWSSSETKKQKIIWTLIPVIFGVILMNLIQGIHHYNLKSKSQKLEFRLEENFKGEIIVFDNVKCGQAEKIINGRKILFVPKNGILYYSKDLTNEGYVDNVFKIKKGEKIIEIPNLQQAMFWNETRKNFKQNYNEETLGAFDIGHFNYYNSNKNFKYLFLIANKKEYDSIDWYKKIGEKIKSIKTEKIKNCR